MEARVHVCVCACVCTLWHRPPITSSEWLPRWWFQGRGASLWQTWWGSRWRSRWPWASPGPWTRWGKCSPHRSSPSTGTGWGSGCPVCADRRMQERQVRWFLHLYFRVSPQSSTAWQPCSLPVVWMMLSSCSSEKIRCRSSGCSSVRRQSAETERICVSGRSSRWETRKAQFLPASIASFSLITVLGRRRRRRRSRCS